MTPTSDNGESNPDEEQLDLFQQTPAQRRRALTYGAKTTPRVQAILADRETVATPRARKESLKQRVGLWVKQNREERGWSLRDLAIRTDTWKARLISIEAGECLPTMRQLAELIEAFKADANEFFWRVVKRGG